MALIKTSALIADIKGKSNGSVFASGPSGTYMRNNPSGGGQKSARWASQKSAFASLASQWRNLTPEQQDAWNAARELYPTTNKFGDSRLPSGFELFMRLNGTIQGLGLAPILEPVAPRSMPEISSLPFVTNDNFCFTPTRGTNLLMPNGTSVVPWSEGFFANSDFETAQLFACRFQVPENKGVFPVRDRLYPLFSSLSNDTIRWAWVLIIDKEGKAEIQCRFEDHIEDTTYITIRERFPIGRLDFSQALHIAVTMSAGDAFVSSLAINGYKVAGSGFSALLGVQQLFAVTLAGTPTDLPSNPGISDYTGSFAIGAYDNSVASPFTISDFRYMASYGTDTSCCGENAVECWWGDECVETADGCECVYAEPPASGGVIAPTASQVIVSLAYGYVTGYETAAVSFDHMVGSLFPNLTSYGSNFGFYLMIEPECTGNDECQVILGVNYGVFLEGCCVIETDEGYIWSPIRKSWTPLMAVPAFDYAGPKDFYVVIENSALIGSGRNTSLPKFTKLVSFPLNGGVAFLSDALVSKIGSMAANSGTALRASIVDGQTGQRYSTEIPWIIKDPSNPSGGTPNGKNVVRFKAGADLSGKLN